MGTRVPVTEISNLQNETSARAAINANFEALSDYIDEVLSLTDDAGNQLDVNLDMNENRILNLPVPTDDLEPARHGDIQTYVDDAETAAAEAEASAVAAALAETAAELAETNAELAEVAAELAETNAEAAEVAAEAAQAAAEAAQAAAEAALGDLNLDSIDNLGDVIITTPSNTQVLKYNGTNWVNAADSIDGGNAATVDSKSISVVSQATYDGLTPDANTLYFII